MEKEAGAATTSTAVALTANCNDNIAQLVFTPASNLTTGGSAHHIYANGTTDAWMAFNAEY
jgi:hypothetical protein